MIKHSCLVCVGPVGSWFQSLVACGKNDVLYRVVCVCVVLGIEVGGLRPSVMTGGVTGLQGCPQNGIQCGTLCHPGCLASAPK